VDAGLPVVVAAGNSDVNACTESPGREPKVLTVGASDNRDRRAYFSNYGPCVDLFAPGRNIVSAARSSNTATASMSGTSMSTPLVAGAVALLQQRSPTASAEAISQELVMFTTTDVLTELREGSPNTLLFTKFAPVYVVPYSMLLHEGGDSAAISLRLYAEPDAPVQVRASHRSAKGAKQAGKTQQTTPVGSFRSVSLDVCVGSAACTWVKSVRCAWGGWCACVLSRCCLCVCAL